MRISFFLPRCTPDNSHGRYVLELAKRLSAEHQISIHASAFWPPIRSKVHCQYLPIPAKPAVFRLAALWATSLVANRRHPVEIVHIQGADAPVGNVVTAHCCNSVMRTAEGASSTIRRNINYAIGAATERFCLSKSSTQQIIAVSEKVRGEITQEYGVDPRKIVVIPNGVDGDAFHPVKRGRLRASIRGSLGFGASDFVVLFVGGDYYLKGLPTLLEAAQRLPKPTRVLVVGGKPDVRIERLSRQGGLNGYVTFYGRATDVAPLYAAADSFALPTRYDSFSLSTLEAMACGLPVVVSRAAGVSELLTHGRDCLVLEDPTAVKDLAQSLHRIRGDESLRNGLGAEARRTAERHSWDEVARSTLAAYEDVLGVDDTQSGRQFPAPLD